MPKTNLEIIRQTRDNLIALREEVSRKKKPSYDVDGQRVNWQQYFEMLTDQIDKLKEQIDAEGDDDIVEVHTTAIPR